MNATRFSGGLLFGCHQGLSCWRWMLLWAIAVWLPLGSWFNPSPSAEPGAGAESALTKGAQFDRPKIEEDGQKITILFSPGEGIQLAKLDGHIAGIQWVVCNGLPVVEMPQGEVVPTPVIEWASAARPFRPIHDWEAYLDERKHHRGRWAPRGEWSSDSFELGASEYRASKIYGRSVVLHFQTESGEVRWVFESRNDRVGRDDYRGVGWRLEVENVPTVIWAHVQEPLPLADDHWYLAQTWGRAFIEKRLDSKTRFTLPLTQQFAFQQPFLFIAGHHASLFDWCDQPAAVRELIERDGEFLVRNVAIPFVTGKGKTFRATPMKYWQVARAERPGRWSKLDGWTEAYEFLARRYRKQRGHRRCEPIPCALAVTPESDYVHFLEHGRPPRVPWLERFAKNKLPKLATIGVRMVYLAAPWECDAEHSKTERKPPTRMPEGDPPIMEEIGSQHAPWDLRISPAIGGPGSLKKLVDEAHRLGVRIVLWCGPAHLSISSPLLKQHPDWPIWRQNGTPDDQDYEDLVGTSLASGFGPFSIKRYRQVKRATGIDGLFFDSYLTFGVSIDFSQSQPHPQLDELLNVERALWQMEMNSVHWEGVGVLGVGVGGFGYETTDYLGRPFPDEVRQFQKIQGREYGLYRFVADTFLEPDSYYRALASKGMISIFSLRQFDRLKPDQQDWIRRANREYSQVLDRMQHRHLIGTGDRWQGVAWTSDDSDDTVLFAFDSFEYPTARETIIEDLTSGKKQTAGGPWQTEPWHTYILHLPRKR